MDPLYVLAFGVIGVAIVAGIFKRARLAALGAARNRYRDALARLSNEPSNRALREQVQRLGRNYAKACERCGVKVFDETALMLDVEAACGPEETASAAPDAASPVQERITRNRSVSEDPNKE